MEATAESRYPRRRRVPVGTVDGARAAGPPPGPRPWERHRSARVLPRREHQPERGTASGSASRVAQRSVLKW